MSVMTRVLGIDIGGSGIKGAPVDTVTGELLAERHRIPTPQPSTPQAVAEVVKQLCEHFEYDGKVGCTFPAVVRHGTTLTAANVDKSWVDAPAQQLLTDVTGRDVSLLNDADAAGLAEARFGAGKGVSGMILLLTLGTGIGSALIVDGKLVPNTEFGHIELGGKEFEHVASDKVREDKDLGWKEWAAVLSDGVAYLERLLWPDLIIIGGGVSKKSEKFLPHLKLQTPVVPAQLRNNAGFVGAALYASGE